MYYWSHTLALQSSDLVPGKLSPQVWPPVFRGDSTPEDGMKSSSSSLSNGDSIKDKGTRWTVSDTVQLGFIVKFMAIPGWFQSTSLCGHSGLVPINFSLWPFRAGSNQLLSVAIPGWFQSTSLCGHSGLVPINFSLWSFRAGSNQLLACEQLRTNAGWR